MQTGKRSSGRSVTAAAAAMAPDVAPIERLLSENPTPERFCAELAKIFHVRPTEVALLRLENGLLKFLFPTELKTAGTIPISSSSAVAAHTAVTKKVELFNSFTKVKHASIFEMVKLGDPETNNSWEQTAIQKLMSAPVLERNDKVLGVVQICRKGFDSASCGPDFTLDDLRQLELTTKALAQFPFMRQIS
jgi:hypothetical protein